MRKGFQRILFAVRDIDAVSPAALRKVAALAAGAPARVELYHALTESIVVERARADRSGQGLEAVLDSIAKDSAAQLARLARTGALRRVRVTSHVDWDYPAHEAIVRRALATKADLVVAETHRHRAGARVFLRNTDWELIRSCPVPLLLLKDEKPYRRPAVLVSVDPFHAADKPASLDRGLLQAGARLAAGLGGALHAVHAWLPLAMVVPTALGAPIPAWLPPEAEAAHEKNVRKAFDRLVAGAGVKPAHRHLVSAAVPDALDAALAKSKAAVLVMGAISRRGLKRLLIGNTAERVLDHVGCDVLVVKPRGFRTTVKPRAAVAARPLVLGPAPY
jgi:universal stress protein E